MTTRIFSCSAEGETYGIDCIDFIWFPEVRPFKGRYAPIHPKLQIAEAPTLIGKTFATLSEYIILWFLLEIAEGRMTPDDVELYCDGKRIRIDADGELIDRWPDGFYQERAALLFGSGE